MKKGFLCTIGCLSAVALLASCTSADEKQLKSDLAGKSNEEVVDFVAEKATEAATTKIQDEKGIKMTLTEGFNLDFKAEKKYGDYVFSQEEKVNANASATFILNYEKGLSLVANVEAKFNEKITGNASQSTEVNAKAALNVVYDKAEDTAYVYYRLEGIPDVATSEQKIKLTGIKENLPSVPEVPGDVTLPETSIPEEYQAIIAEIKAALAEYKTSITFEIEDDQVKLIYSITKDDILKLIDNSMVQDLLAQAGLNPVYIAQIKTILATDAVTLTNQTKIGFNKDYLPTSVDFSLGFGMDYEGVKINGQNSTVLNVEYGEFGYSDVTDKDAYTDMSDSKTDITPAF